MLAPFLLLTLAAPPQALPDPYVASAPDVRLLLARLSASDPPIEEVQAAAARRAAATAEEAESWRRRARLAPWLPRLIASAKRDDRTQRVVGLTATSEVDYLRLSPGQEVGVRLEWSLDRLVFAEAELRGTEAAAQAARRRLDAAERATKLYFRRRELLVGLWLSPPADAQQRALSEIALEQVTAELDAVTGGLFGGRR